MNSKRITVLLLCSIILSCNKPLTDYSNLPFDFKVTGITGISIPANSFTIFNPELRLLSGNPANQPVTITFKGMPPNVYLQKDNFTCRANYNLNDSIGARNATPGVYPVQVIFSNASTGAKTYDFDLTIAGPIDRVADAIGYYHQSNTCGYGLFLYCTIDSVPGMPGKLMFINRTPPSSGYATYDTCYGIVDCCTNTFVIPSQVVQGTSVEGYGSFSGPPGYKRVTISKTITTDTGSYPCIVTLSQ